MGSWAGNQGQYQNLQGDTVPSSGPFSINQLMLGFRFVLSQSAKWIGFRVYQEDAEIRAAFAQVWRLDDDVLVGQGMPPARSVNKVQTGAGWHTYYIRPQVVLDADTPYGFQVAMDGGNTRTTVDGLNTSVVSGIITALGGDVG